jgi:chromosome segregation ATPase
MISTTPTVAEINAAIDFLTILEMAKDAKKLKDSLAQIQQAQSALADEAASANKAKAEAEAAVSKAQKKSDEIETKLAKLDEANRLHIRNTEDLANERAAMRDERSRFDEWMAKEREELDRVKSVVSSQASQNNLRSSSLDARAAELDKRADNLARLEEAAQAMKAEYEQKVANLKQFIS